MKDFLFILSHKGAGSTLLSRILNSTYKIAAVSNTQILYNHIKSLEVLTGYIETHPFVMKHKPLYCDTIVSNTDFYCPQLYECCKFIFLIREPNDTIQSLPYKSIYNYYRFRLRRLYEQSKLTKKSICITYEELITRQAFPVIENFLNLNQNINELYDPWPTDTGNLASGKIVRDTFLPSHFIQPVQITKYEKYLNRIKENCYSG